jgi:hypothetical protein
MPPKLADFFKANPYLSASLNALPSTLHPLKLTRRERKKATSGSVPQQTVSMNMQGGMEQYSNSKQNDTPSVKQSQSKVEVVEELAMEIVPEAVADETAAYEAHLSRAEIPLDEREVDLDEEDEGETAAEQQHLLDIGGNSSDSDEASADEDREIDSSPGYRANVEPVTVSYLPLEQWTWELPMEERLRCAAGFLSKMSEYLCTVKVKAEPLAANVRIHRLRAHKLCS